MLEVGDRITPRNRVSVCEPLVRRQAAKGLAVFLRAANPCRTNTDNRISLALTDSSARIDYHGTRNVTRDAGWLVGVDIPVCVELVVVKRLDTVPAAAAVAYFTGENLHWLETPIEG